MGRTTWFISGCFVGSLFILNQVYETELLKQELKNEVDTIRRMKNFVKTNNIEYV